MIEDIIQKGAQPLDELIARLVTILEGLGVRAEISSQ